LVANALTAQLMLTLPIPENQLPAGDHLQARQLVNKNIVIFN
jgi:hypothetical protein